MNRIATSMLLLATAAVLPPAAGQAQDWSIEIGGGAYQTRPVRAPIASDVLFSMRRPRQDALGIAKDFQANRMEWIYANDARLVDSLKFRGFHVGLTLNANPVLGSDDGYARDFDGRVIVAPWMKSWGAKWATTNSPKTIAVILNEARKLVAAGADSIQFDDPNLQYATTKWAGGDFSDDSLREFKRYLVEKNLTGRAAESGFLIDSGETYRDHLAAKHGIKSASDYITRKNTLPLTAIWETFLMSSVRDFHVSLKQLLRSEGGRYTPLSFNMSLTPDAKSLYMADIPDYVLAESQDYDLAAMGIRIATARAIPVGYVASLIPRGIDETRTAIAAHYAAGAPVVAPWDTYMPDIKGITQPRYYGAAKDYSDIFQFVRDNRSLFDNYEAMPVVVVTIPINNANQTELRRVVGVLTRHAIPYAFALSGGLFKDFQLDDSRLRAAKFVVRLGTTSDYREQELKALTASKSVVAASAVTDDWARNNRPLTMAADETSTATLRARTSPAPTVTLHLIPRSKGGATSADLANLTVSIARWCLPKNANRARIFTLGQSTRVIDIQPGNDDVAITVPRAALWSVVQFSHESL